MGYPKQVYKKAGEELARRREAAHELTEARAREIADKIPEIPKLQREMAETARAVTRIVIASPRDAKRQLDILRDRNLELQRRRGELLEQAGYSADYLAEQSACPKCGGGGYEGSAMCDCFRELLKKEAYAGLSAVSQVKNSSFSDFSLDMYPDSRTAKGSSPRAHMADVLAFCKEYAGEFSCGSPSLLMIGNTGLGKTHLSLAIAKVVTERGFGVVYTPVQKLTDKLEASKFSYAAEAKEQYARDMENFLSCDLLVLDDLGAEFITQFSSSALYNIVNTRLVEAKPVIISTNLDPADIESKYSPRMLSRLMGGCRALKFVGKDIRFEKKIRK